jgi:predicted phage terminase large subunit-like protein
MAPTTQNMTGFELGSLLAPDGISDVRFIKARDSFWEYCKIINPKFYRDDRPYLRELGEDLQAFYERRLINPKTKEAYRKFMMNLPPRHGKSYILTLFCQWVFGRNFLEQIITVSYNETLSGRFARNVRDGIDATKADDKITIFRDMFPTVQIKFGDAATQMWALEGSFFSYLAAGFGGTITGIGCSIGIIDDPIKSAKEAYNDRVLEEQWSWYCDTFLSRLEEGALQIVNMTRWSTKDLCGHLLDAEADDWYVFKRQAYNEETGQMLCPSLLSYASYQDKARKTSAPIMNANYQQTPVDIEGRLYPSFQVYTALPKFERVISYTDTADEGTDYLCSIVAGQAEGRAYALDVIYTPKPMEVTEPLVAKQLFLNKVGYARIESNNGGRGFARKVQDLLWQTHKTRKPHIEWFHQGENKKARILTNCSSVMNDFLMPLDWESRWPEFAVAMQTYQAAGKNPHDDAPDAATGIIETMEINPKRRLKTMSKALLGL